MSAANQYDRMNDPELGSGIHDKQKDTAPRCACGNKIENAWYGAKQCYECQRAEAEYKRTHPSPLDDLDIAEHCKALAIVGEYIPPDPEMSAWGFPWNGWDDKLLSMIEETEAKYPEAWKHPARSDRSKYTKRNDVFWNGDL